MPLRYVRVKDTRTGHEFDVLEQQVDKDNHQPLSQDRYPITSRPRAPKPFRGKDGEPATPGDRVRPELTLKNNRDELEKAAETAGIDHTDLTKPQILDALAAKTSGEQ